MSQQLRGQALRELIQNLCLGLTAHLYLFMSVREEDQLQTIEELNARSQSIPKACSLGLIIDSTNAYFDEQKQKFVKKIKLVDESYNTNRYNPHQKYPYLTVFFYSSKIEDLPNPKMIGDLLYMRRFSFGHYNESFQGHYVPHPYCSWALANGDTKSVHPEEYQTSREDMNLEDEKFQNLTSRIRSLRAFGRQYLAATSVLSILPIGISTKDFDLVVEVTKRGEDGYRLNTGKEELTLNGISSYATEGSIAKLRSVARIDSVGKSKVVVPNNFTSLINIPNWSQDSEIYRKNFTSMDIEDDDSIYTSLAQLNSMPLNECENKKYYVKVEVAGSSTSDFVQALKFYDEKKSSLSDAQRKDTIPVYRFNFVCIDESLAKNNRFSEIWLFSYDGKGSDFVDRVKLSDLNEFSNYNSESKYFSNRVEEILNSEYVKMTVEVLSDGKGNRTLRALSVN